MYQGLPDDQTGTTILERLRGAASVTTIEGVIEVMEELDETLPPSDGVRWFNLLYLMVTRAVYESPPDGGWADARWLTRLDVVFAKLYFDALARWHTDPATVPRVWAALLSPGRRARTVRTRRHERPHQPGPACSSGAHVHGAADRTPARQPAAR